MFYQYLSRTESSGYIDEGVYSKENSENVITEYLKSLDDENIENTNK